MLSSVVSILPPILIVKLGKSLWVATTYCHHYNDNFQFLEAACSLYSCHIWRCFLVERSENCGAQQLPTRGILSPLMVFFFSLILALDVCFVFFFFNKTFCYTICLCYVFVIILPTHCFLCLHFTPGTFNFVSKITGWYASLNLSTPMFLDLCQTILEQRHDLFRAQISTPSWHC